MVFDGEDQLSFDFMSWFFHCNVCIKQGMLFKKIPEQEDEILRVRVIS